MRFKVTLTLRAKQALNPLRPLLKNNHSCRSFSFFLMNASLITSDSAASCCMLMPQYIRTLWSIGLEHQYHNLGSGWNIDGFCEQTKLRKSFNDEQVCNECPTRPTVSHCDSVLDSGHLTTIKQQRFKPQCLRWKKHFPFFIWQFFFRIRNQTTYQQHYIAKKCKHVLPLIFC